MPPYFSIKSPLTKRGKSWRRSTRTSRSEDGWRELAAAYINGDEELRKAGKWRMQEGESWFCEKVHKVWYPER